MQSDLTIEKFRLKLFELSSDGQYICYLVLHCGFTNLIMLLKMYNPMLFWRSPLILLLFLFSFIIFTYIHHHGSAACLWGMPKREEDLGLRNRVLIHHLAN